MKKILFLHGFFATGSCRMAIALREAFEGGAIVLTPDLPLHPQETLKYIRTLIDKEKPDLLVGNSCGAFLGSDSCPRGRYSRLTRQSLFQDDGVSEGAYWRTYVQGSEDGRQSKIGHR